MTRRERFVWKPGQPLPDGISDLARAVAELVLSIPPGRWVSWGDLAEVLGTTPRGVAEAGLTLTPESANKQVTWPQDWPVPWHRVRMSDGSHKEPSFVSFDENLIIIAIGGEWWEREGGRWDGVRGGKYHPGCHWALARQAAS